MASDNGSTSNGGWHAIRPWSPPLSLNTREVTSVSVTFILSSHLTDINDDSLGLILAEEAGDDEDRAEESHDAEALETKKKSIISDALAKGLSVNVNGSPWQRVFIRVDDAADEAIIIIYGLMPGRQYDIDLGLVKGDANNKIRRQVVTEDADLKLEPQDELTDPDSPSFSHSTSSDPAPSTPSTSPTRTRPNTPPSSNIPLTAEDHLSQLERTLSVLNAERETLTASLKSSRRDAQKADASLRSEIDILKRASEKHVAADQRAKQKILSLQEALKRAQTATRETEELVREAEKAVPGLKKQREEKEKEYAKAKDEADRVQKEKERLLEKEKKRIEAMKTELAGLTNKAEKLNTKKEKLETGTIFELEEQLKEIEQQVEKVQNESGVIPASVFPDRGEFAIDDFILAEPDPRSPAYPYLPTQRLRQPHSPGTIGSRPAPIQRPQPADQLSFPNQSRWTLIAPPHQQQSQTSHSPSQSYSHSQPQQPRSHHNPRSSSLQFQHTPILLTNPNRHSSVKSTGTPQVLPTPTSSVAINPSPTSTSPSTTIPSSTSTLSSRAPAFEPGRPLKHVPSQSSGSSTGQRSTSGSRVVGSRGAAGKSSNTNAKTGTNPTTNASKSSARKHSTWTPGQYKAELI